MSVGLTTTHPTAGYGDDDRVRTLIAALSAIGLVLGAAAAMIWHYTRLRHNVDWYAYAPLSASTNIRLVRPGWWPALLIFPSVGLGIGLLAGAALTRLGWRLTRDPPAPRSASPAA